jgi:tripartite-type tricarboxylate transporter receptor subunit TctC
MVVPYAAGGTFDVMGRIIAVRMSEILGQQIVVENTTGAGGIIGVNRVVNAVPDGYTILLGSTGTHAYNQTIYKKRRYDAINDFTPVTLFSEQPMVLEARKDLPASTIPEFAALLKANGAKMQFGSAGAGSTTHLACSLLNATIGVNVTHVPYRGSAPAANDLIGGQIDYLCGNLGAAAPPVSRGCEASAVAPRTVSCPRGGGGGTTEFDGQNGRLLLLLLLGGVSLLGPLLEQVVPNTAPHRKGKPAWGGAAGSSSDTTGPEAPGRRRWPLAACA